MRDSKKIRHTAFKISERGYCGGHRRGLLEAHLECSLGTVLQRESAVAAALSAYLMEKIAVVLALHIAARAIPGQAEICCRLDPPAGTAARTAWLPRRQGSES